MNVTVASHGRYAGQPAPWIVYVGRSEWAGRTYDRALYVLGNPYPLRMGRRACVEAYRGWLWDRINEGDWDVVRALKELLEVHQEHGKLVLVCHCIDTDDISGFHCHAQVIARALRWLERNKEVS